MRFDALAFLESLFQVPATAPGTMGTCRQSELATLPDFPPSISPQDLPADWHFLWDERAAIMEYDGGMTKEHAEAAALKDILRQMRQSGVSFPHT